MPIPTRMRPLSSSSLNAERRAATVDTSAFGEFAPSLVRKIGSSPAVSSKRCRIDSGVTLHPVRAWWQVEQLRPLLPYDLKNGLFRSIRCVLYVAEAPLALGRTSV